MNFGNAASNAVSGNLSEAQFVIAGILYAITLHLRWLKHKNRLDLWYSIHELRPLALMGFLALATGTAGFVYHLAIQIMSRTREYINNLSGKAGCAALPNFDSYIFSDCSGGRGRSDSAGVGIYDVKSGRGADVDGEDIQPR